MHRVSSFIATAFIATALLALGLFAAAAGADDWPTCRAAKGDEPIAACSRLIESGQLDVSRLAEAYSNRGVARQRRGDSNGAIADLDRAIQLNPKLAVAYNNRCLTYSDRRNYDRAIADCDQSIRLDPKLTVAYDNLCRMRILKGDLNALRNCAPAGLDPKLRDLVFGSSPNVSSATPVVSNPSSRTEVPLKAVGGTFVVPVAINGAITLNFIIDSGAADVTVPADVVGTLIRTGTIEQSDFIGTQTYILADGSESPSNTFVIRSLKVGDALVENVKGSIAPAAGNLLLGQSFLQRFKSWSIDNTKHELVLEPR
jgi:tetratricopeptide (TPR) repeat protein